MAATAWDIKDIWRRWKRHEGCAFGDGDYAAVAENRDQRSAGRCVVPGANVNREASGRVGTGHVNGVERPIALKLYGPVYQPISIAQIRIDDVEILVDFDLRVIELEGLSSSLRTYAEPDSSDLRNRFRRIAGETRKWQYPRPGTYRPLSSDRHDWRCPRRQ